MNLTYSKNFLRAVLINASFLKLVHVIYNTVQCGERSGEIVLLKPLLSRSDSRGQTEGQTSLAGQTYFPVQGPQAVRRKIGLAYGLARET